MPEFVKRLLLFLGLYAGAAVAAIAVLIVLAAVTQHWGAGRTATALNTALFGLLGLFTGAAILFGWLSALIGGGALHIVTTVLFSVALLATLALLGFGATILFNR